ncbi:hypothetical protein N7517_003844 [Penicillium concentricum]|uniref:Uncharacterized protein n=1 Tax=Penicillium concentricum TaxID=293559 RepID=A0A9W9S4C8_9EURO|nr:uncharacterized protein N7517_003844 [Penicillium concentricum]KAJ5371838.1 hypothetical protein N7517_003844 [Penicillium concentricum]
MPPHPSGTSHVLFPDTSTLIVMTSNTQMNEPKGLRSTRTSHALSTIAGIHHTGNWAMQLTNKPHSFLGS